MQIAGVVVLVAIGLSGSVVEAGQDTGRAVQSGEALYRSACAACHAADGTGAPASIVGFDTPLPDFTDCSFATREPVADWFAIAHAGGPVRAFDRRMPAFGEALAEHEIASAVAHVKTFCAESAWPQGELNLPRPLVTEKAYPEDEAVLTSTFDAGPSSAMSHQFLYERRVGARYQLEIAVPLSAHRASDGQWQGGLGDVAVAVKRVLAHSLARGGIVSITGEVVFPTGKDAQGLGNGTTVFEPLVTAGQLLPGNAFLHAQAGVELPARSGMTREVFWRAALGRTWDQGRFGRAWSPILELLGTRELVAGTPVMWDVVPQLQVTLSRRQHVMINGGVRIPVSPGDGRHVQVITYLLWDWFDGGLLDGWR